METYGCQMNVADTEVVRSVLQGAGYSHAASLSGADVVLLNTCAIRENAEAKIWARLRAIRAERRKEAAGWRARGGLRPTRTVVGLLGCMGERLKGKLLEEDQLVDVVCGPDAYRALPRLLAQARGGLPFASLVWEARCRKTRDRANAWEAPLHSWSGGSSHLEV